MRHRHSSSIKFTKNFLILLALWTFQQSGLIAVAQLYYDDDTIPTYTFLDFLEITAMEIMTFACYLFDNNLGGDLCNLLSNDRCNDAIAIVLDDGEPNKVRGSTVSASVDLVESACFGSDQPQTTGVWYSVEGNGRPLRATACTEEERDENSNENPFRAVMTIYEGQCGTYNLTCVEKIQRSDITPSCEGGESFIDWFSQLDTTYYILVYGLFDSTRGDFTITVNEVNRPSNDYCTGATPINIGDFYTESTSIASIDNVTDVGSTTMPCGGASTSIADGGPGLWYRFVGNGQTLVASTCLYFGANNYDVQISVFSSNKNNTDDTSCTDLQCVGGGDDECNLQGHVKWTTVNNTIYYIYVYSFHVEERGLFALSLGLPPDNDECNNATEVFLNDTSLTFTYLATVDTVDECGSNVVTEGMGPGIWYKIRGNGSVFDASTCWFNRSSPFVFLDTQISVYSTNTTDLSSCATGDEWTCITGNDDSGCDDGSFPQLSNVLWKSEVDVMYYIFVFGFGGRTGTVQFSIQEGIVQLNNECVNATRLEIGEPVRNQNTVDSTKNESVPLCGDATAHTSPGLWYSVSGTGGFLQATTCTNDDEIDDGFDTQISVFNATCDTLSCIDGSDDECSNFLLYSTVNWLTTLDEIYYILVQGYDGQVGEFELVVNRYP